MTNSVKEVIRALLEIEKLTVLSSEESTNIQEDQETPEDQYESALDDSIQDDHSLFRDPMGLEVDTTDELEIAILAKTPSLLNTGSSPLEVSSGTTIKMRDSSLEFGNIRRENLVGEADDEMEITEKGNLRALPLSEDVVEDGNCNEVRAAATVIDKPEEENNINHGVSRE